MNISMKKKTLVASILTIALCFSVIAGATFALFTSESNINIAVTSGKVKLVATIDENSLATSSLGIEQIPGTFANGGTATFDNETNLDLTNITPGDKATFKINVKNESTVDVMYKITWNVNNEDMNALKVTSNGEDVADLGWTLWAYEDYNNASAVSEGYDATEIVPSNSDTKTLNVEIELPMGAGNEYQAKEASITFKVEAVQGNAGDLDLEAAFENGGIITTGGVPVSVDELTNENGEVVGGAFIGENDTTFKDIVINKTTEGQSYAVAMGSNSGDLTLDSGAVINAGAYYGITAMPERNGIANINMNSGSKISASGNNATCIFLTGAGTGGTANIYLNASGLLDPQNGAKGIWITDNYDAVNIYVKDMVAFKEYYAMTECYRNPNPDFVRWYINGVEHNDIETVAGTDNA